MAIETPIPLNRKVQYFAASVSDALPYIKASRSYLADQLSGKKFGQTYFFYLPDPGSAEVGTQDLDISKMNRSVFERAIPATVMSGKSAVDLTAWNKMQDLEDFVKEIASPRGRRLAAEIEKDIIAKNVWISDNAFVVPKNADGTSGLTAGAFQLLASKLRGVKAAGKLVGFAHPNVFGEAAVKFLSLFIPSEIQTRVYNDVYLGDYAKTSWVEENFMPALTIDALPTITKATFNAPVKGGTIGGSDGTITVTGTNLKNGVAFTATYTDPIDSTTKSYGTVDLNCMPVPGEKKVFIVVDVNEDGTEGRLAGTFRFSSNGKTAEGALVEQTNPSLSGDEAALANATWTVLDGLEAGKSYLVMQARDNDWLEFDSAKFPELPGCENGSESVGGIGVQTAEWGDVNTRTSIMRIDVPYVAVGVDARLSRICYIEI